MSMYKKSTKRTLHKITILDFFPDAAIQNQYDSFFAFSGVICTLKVHVIGIELFSGELVL